MSDRFSIDWVDGRREPRCNPDSDYPDGLDIVCPDAIDGKSCKVVLPYPAKRCGYYVVRCVLCGMTAGITTAGRRDDPRSVTMGCKKK